MVIALIDINKLKKYRETSGLSQTDFAKRVGISQTQYSRIETGESGASIETLDAIIQVLGIGISDIWTSENTIQMPFTPPAMDGGLIIIEYGDRRNKKRLLLPPTKKTYHFLAEQLDNNLDHRLQLLIDTWETSCEEIKALIYKNIMNNIPDMDNKNEISDE